MEDVADAPEAIEIAASGLLDPAWYLRRYRDVATASMDARAHFCRHGWREGRAPNAWVDHTWYLAEYPDVAAAGIDPALHYVRHGEAEGRRPSAHFDAIWYRTAYDLPQGTLALAHYVTRGGDGTTSPSVALWAAAYLPRYRDAGNDGDPYLVCIQDAAARSTAPCPDIALVTASGLVDANYYLIKSGDVLDAGVDPVAHFCTHGWREHRRPNLYFDTDWYLQTNAEAVRLGINPLVHYIALGEAAGRRPVIYFDPAWYRAAYADELAATELAPLAHYLAHRRSQSYSPNPGFDVAWYLATYGAEIGAGRDPFAHYLYRGTLGDTRPAANFAAAADRREQPGRRRILYPERDNPLVQLLRSQYV